MAPRGPTAYFLFAGEIREAVQEEIAAANDGKAGVAAVGKAIGEKWNALSDEEKQSYKDRAAQITKDMKEQQAAETAAAGGGEDDDDDAQEAAVSSAPPPAPFGFPTTVIKKISSMDPEVDRITADGVRALAKATALFVELLATKSLDHAAQLKRKNFKFGDLAVVARRDRRMGDMGLAELLANDAAFAEVHERAGDENQGRRGGKKTAAEAAQEEAAKRTKPLTAFFGVAAQS